MNGITKKGSFVYTRRGMFGLSAAAALTFASFPQRVSSTANESDSVDLRYAPQFYIGNPEAATRIDVAWSIQCQYTRLLVKGGLGTFAEQLLDRNDALLVFHHLCRHEKEIGYSEVFLSLDPAYYGPACLITMQYYAARKKDPGKWQFKQFIKKLRLPKDPGFDKKAANETSILLNRYLTEEEQVDKTPSLLSNGKWTIGASPEDFAQVLKESGYES